MKKNTIILLAALMLISTTAISCKKGKDDPGISLRSRKARMAGEWKITAYTENGQNAIGQGESYEMVFDKDGSGELIANDNGNIDITKVTWGFLGSSKDSKNKERFYWQEDGDISLTIFDIVELSNDKVKLFSEEKSGSNVYKMEITFESK